MAASASLEHTIGEGETAQDSSHLPDPGIAHPPFTAPRVVDVVCRVDPLCDYLLWVLYRQDRFNHRPPMPPGEPVTERYGHFPQFAAARGAQEPAEVLALLPEYAEEELAQYDLPISELRTRLEPALGGYRAFLHHWGCEVKPLEEGLLDGWRDQLTSCEPLALFQRLTRRPLPHDRLYLYACYYHPSGSALTPYPYLFTTLFNRFSLEPTVAWFVGHEATHLLLDEARWWETPAGRTGIERYGSRHAAEEPLCFLLQNRLSSTCGLLLEEEMQRIDAGAAPNIPLFLWLQERWDEYQENPERYPTIIEFFLDGLARAGGDEVMR
jgi:hypothetical protein